MISTSFDATRSRFFGAQNNDRHPRATTYARTRPSLASRTLARLLKEIQ